MAEQKGGHIGGKTHKLRWSIIIYFTDITQHVAFKLNTILCRVDVVGRKRLRRNTGKRS